MSNIKNGGLDQYGAEPFEQQQFETADVEGINTKWKISNKLRGGEASGFTVEGLWDLEVWLELWSFDAPAADAVILMYYLESISQSSVTRAL